jgi:rubredoxin-NAD+ reductase
VGNADSGLAAGTRWDDIPQDWACPICGVGKADFEPLVEAHVSAAAPVAAGRRAAPLKPDGDAPGPAGSRAPGQRADGGMVIVGAGRAGWAVAQALREQGWAGPLTMVTACAGDVYDKPQLSVAVARGLDPTNLVRESAATAAARLGLHLRCGTHAVAIDAAARRLRTTRGSLRYQHLVLAQGAEPALPAVLPAALAWRVNDLAAYQRLRAALAPGPQWVAIVGAGLVGCELANDLALAGHQITLLDTQALPLAAQLPAIASQRLLQAWQELPIVFRGGVQVSALTRVGSGPGALRLELKDGSCIDVDHVIAATGLRTAGRLAASAGLAFDAAAGGVVVSAGTGATSVSGIHALGDCVVVNGQASRYIEPIARQAQAIAAAILKPERPVTDAPQRPPPVLRVKTSTLPITITGLTGASGTWRTEVQTPTELRLTRLGPQGQAVGSLIARTP